MHGRKSMAEELSVLELVSKVDEFVAVSEIFDDEDLDSALGSIVKLIMKPDVPPQAAMTLITKLQAISCKLQIQASYYKNVLKPAPGTIEYKKKNLCFTLSEALNALVAALKYNIRSS